MCKKSSTPLQNLCQSCGLCCDGTIFGSADLDSQDVTIPLENAGVHIHLTENRKYINLPCTAHKHKTCTIYKNRPRICQTYSCKLLSQFHNEEISWEAATGIIAETVLQRDKLKEQIHAIMPITAPTTWQHITKTFEDTQRNLYGDSVVKKFGEIFLGIAVLKFRIERFFHNKKEENKVSV